MRLSATAMVLSICLISTPAFADTYYAHSGTLCAERAYQVGSYGAPTYSGTQISNENQQVAVYLACPTMSQSANYDYILGLTVDFCSNVNSLEPWYAFGAIFLDYQGDLLYSTSFGSSGSAVGCTQETLYPSGIYAYSATLTAELPRNNNSNPSVKIRSYTVTQGY